MFVERAVHEVISRNALSLSLEYSLQPYYKHSNNSCRPYWIKQSNIVIRPLLQTRTVGTDCSFCCCCCRKVSTTLQGVSVCDTCSFRLWVPLLREYNCICCRQMVSQTAMRGQRVVESECRCWNPAVWLLVSLLGSLVLVALSVLTRLGKCDWGLVYSGFIQKKHLVDLTISFKVLL